MLEQYGVGIAATVEYKHNWYMANRERMLQKMKTRYNIEAIENG